MPLPTPIREQVLAALFQALQAGLAADGGEAVATIERNRRPANQVFPAVFQVDAEAGEDVLEETGVDRITATVLLEGQVQAEGDEDIGPAQNLLAARVLRVALANPTLGGVAVNMMRGDVAYTLEREASPPTASFQAELRIEYWTVTGDPFTAAY